VPRARGLLSKCFRDVAVEDVLAHADAKESNPKTAAFESCDTYATTTFASGECLAEHVQNERARVRKSRRTFDASVRPSFDEASRAAETYAEARGRRQSARRTPAPPRGSS
jgi:hypothetical protein